MPSVLERTFYSRSSLAVARDLIGKTLVRNLGRGRFLRGIIVETEAYGGLKDPASHAYGGMTRRNEAMFGEAGYAYVYFTYGFHHCLNVVTGSKGDAQAVLLRALEPVEGIDIMRRFRGIPADSLADIASGPGKICQAFAIDLTLNKVDVTRRDSPIFLETERQFQKRKILRSPRIGITSAREKKWRFYDVFSEYVSHRSKINLPVKAVV